MLQKGKSKGLKIAEIKKLCEQKNARLTKLRYLVLKLIYQSKKPIKAYDLLEKLKQKLPNAKPITIYRSLDFLLGMKLIHKINKTNAYFPCSHPLDCVECYFLLCSKCQHIAECCSQDITKQIQFKADYNNFTPLKINLEIEGICKNCSSTSVI